MFSLMVSSLQDESPKKSNTPQVDEELLIDIAKGYTEALSTLYGISYPAVYSFAYSILKNTQDAQDVAQDTFVRIFASAKFYKKQGKPMAWILTITKNLAYMRIRSKSKVSLDEMDSDSNPLPAVEFEENSMHRLILDKALATLPDETRQIVILHAVSGLRHREIADLLSIKLSTVLSKYNRAIKKVKEILEEDGYNG